MNNQIDDAVEIDLQELIGLIVHWLWLIIGCGILTAAIGFAISYFVITPQYESTTRVYILNSDDSSSLTYSDTQLATQLTKDYEELITSRYVLEQVIEQFGLDMSYEGFKSTITIENTSDTRIIDITVKNESPILAQQLADAIRDIAAEKIKDVMDIEAVNVVDEANLSESPCEPSVTKWTAIGFLIGAIAAAAVVVIRFLLDDTIKSSDDIEKYLGLSTLALIPDASVPDRSRRKNRSSGSEHSSTSGEGRTHHHDTEKFTEAGKETGTQDREVVDLEAI